MTQFSIPAELPWWKSKVIIGAAVSILAKVLVASGVIEQVSPEDSEALASAIVTVIGVAGDMMAIGSRVSQKYAPKITT